MALIKEIENSANGMISSYHKIMSFTRNEDSSKINILIRTYKSKEYRDKEKEYNTKYNYFQPMYGRIVEIMNKTIESRTDEEKEILDGAMEFDKWMANVAGEPFHLKEKYIEIDDDLLDEDYSISKCYQVLKTIEPYDGAEDDI